MYNTNYTKLDMRQTVLICLLDDYADWEAAFLTTALNTGVVPGGECRYVPKIVAPTLDPVRSLGGFRVVPDYNFENLPEEYVALVLIGGTQWQSEEALRVRPLVEQAMARGKIVGAICNAASWLAANGFLNQVRHTGNTLEQLQLWGGSQYTNASGYVEAQAVSDGRIVTANGTGTLEFARELLLLLEADVPERIQDWYRFNKQGLYSV